MRPLETQTLLAVQAGRLFDGDRGLGPSTVLIAGGRIIDVDTPGAPPPVHAEVLDLGRDVCVLPGLIDAHVHLAFDASSDVVSTVNAVDDGRLLVQMARAARRALRAGITTVRDLGDRSFLALTLREQLGQCPHGGPEIVASGPPITVRGGHCHFLGGTTDGPQELRAAVRERAERGCDFVKVMVSGDHLTAGSSPYNAQYERIASHLEVVIESVARLHRAGARIVPGSDAGVAPHKPHDVLPYGLVSLTGLGMTHLEALRATTSMAADACGLTGRKGRLIPGADADLLAVTGNPLADIRAIHDIAAVFRAGHRVH
jgi:imidazolonepropionase-like amidohydrolase